ncbi:pyridoxamine 5'-phosphate oxidase [Gammaproteobacteria bacterium 45_16_T64]|nr:pyridoxamine 5'-phosphate oxidase [Gammaproteobacteria bacterium 45_16_T64]
MATQYPEISDKLQSFIEDQKIFFVGTATADSRVNISPKGMDSFRILGKNRIAWLNITGSGNETAAHVQENDRMTIMFAAFEGKPMILRLYGHAKAIHRNDAEWEELYANFPDMVSARQIFDLSVDLVQVSCGMAVPFFDFSEDRNQLRDWADKQGEDGIKQYWEKKNQTSIDGIPTHIIEKNIEERSLEDE